MPVLRTSSTLTEDVSGADATATSSPSPTPAETTDGGASSPSPTPMLPSVVNPIGSLVDAAREFGPRLALHAGAVFLAFLLIGVGVAVIAAPRAARIVRDVAPDAAVAAAGAVA